LPLVAIPKTVAQLGRSGGCKQILLSMGKLVFEDVCFVGSAWESRIIVMDEILKFTEILLKCKNNFDISKFYRV
jgi:hypothetical protein